MYSLSTAIISGTSRPGRALFSRPLLTTDALSYRLFLSLTSINNGNGTPYRHYQQQRHHQHPFSLGSVLLRKSGTKLWPTGIQWSGFGSSFNKTQDWSTSTCPMTALVVWAYCQRLLF